MLHISWAISKSLKKIPQAFLWILLKIYLKPILNVINYFSSNLKFKTLSVVFEYILFIIKNLACQNASCYSNVEKLWILKE